LSACAYGVAFGALQLTPGRIAPGLPNLAEQRKALKPLSDSGKVLNAKFDTTLPGTPERAAALGPIKANMGKQKPLLDEVKKFGNQTQFFQEMGGLVGRIVLALADHHRHRSPHHSPAAPGARPHHSAAHLSLLYKQDAGVFSWGMACAGFVTTVAIQFPR
jgi:hypothetical protein